MTPAQKRLARHALGLPNSTGRSYRNRYLASYCPGPYDDWQRMADAGLAAREKRVTRPDNCVWFWLTRSGALAALEPGETLNPEDFPMERTQ